MTQCGTPVQAHDALALPCLIKSCLTKIPELPMHALTSYMSMVVSMPFKLWCFVPPCCHEQSASCHSEVVTSKCVCIQAEREVAQELAAARHDWDSLHKEDAQELRVPCCLLAMCRRWYKSVLCIKSLIVQAKTYASEKIMQCAACIINTVSMLQMR